MSQWSRLSRTTQFHIALAVARRRGRELMKRYPNVLGVGAGYRALSQTALPIQEVCLRFLVNRKWKRRISGAGSIPRRIRAQVSYRGRPVKVAIPTDVSEFRGGKPHADLDVTAGITSRKGGTQREYGSACCLVYNRSHAHERYILSCYHVFSPGLNEPPGTIDCIVSPSGPVVGSMLEMADPSRPVGAVDAALTLVKDASIDGLVSSGNAIRGCATDYDIANLPAQSQLYVYGRANAARPGPLPGAFHSYFPNPLPFDYRSTAGKVLYFSDTLEYVASVKPGDSGAAVADANGTLYGMHFYGKDNIGYAFSAPRLFDPGVFPFSIELV